MLRGKPAAAIISPWDTMAVEPLDFSLDNTSGDRLGVHPISLVKRTVTAFVGRTERGPLNEPVPIENFEQYQNAFGGHCSFSFVSHTVQHYFSHGGKAAVIVRVANHATRARVEVPADGQFLHLQARYPGAHEFLRVSIDYDRAQDSPDLFNLVIQRLRGPGTSLIVDQEIHAGISVRHSDPRFVVDALQDSKLVRLSGPLPGNRPNATLPTFPGQPIPYIPMTAPGTDGEELTDYDIIGSNRQSTGIFALERTPGIDLLCIPPAPSADRGTTAFLAAERFCEKHRAVLIWDPPAAWVTAHTAVIGIRNGSYSSHNAMTYFPRIRPRGEYVRFSSGLPACGAVAGLLARRDSCGIWQAAQAAPGSLRASLMPIASLRDSEVALLKRFGVNAFAAKGGTSILTGNSTLDGVNSLSKFWQRLDRRRLLFFILKSIEGATRWVCEPSRSDTTVKQLERQVRVFLTGLFEQGALAGKTTAQTFFVQARQSLPGEPSVVLRFGFALHAPNEFLIYETRYESDGMIIRHVPTLDAEQLLL
jgi:hypothetical protein